MPPLTLCKSILFGMLRTTQNGGREADESWLRWCFWGHEAHSPRQFSSDTLFGADSACNSDCRLTWSGPSPTPKMSPHAVAMNNLTCWDDLEGWGMPMAWMVLVLRLPLPCQRTNWKPVKSVAQPLRTFGSDDKMFQGLQLCCGIWWWHPSCRYGMLDPLPVKRMQVVLRPTCPMAHLQVGEGVNHGVSDHGFVYRSKLRKCMVSAGSFVGARPRGWGLQPPFNWTLCLSTA